MNLKSEAKPITLTTKIELTDAKQKLPAGYEFVAQKKHLSGDNYEIVLSIQCPDAATTELVGELFYTADHTQNSLRIWDMFNRSSGKFKKVGAALHEIAFRESVSIPQFEGRIKGNSTRKAFFFHYAMGSVPVDERIIGLFGKEEEDFWQLCKKYSDDLGLLEQIASHTCYARAKDFAKEWLKKDEVSPKEVVDVIVSVKISDVIQTVIQEARGKHVIDHTRFSVLHEGRVMQLVDPVIIQKKKEQFGIKNEIVADSKGVGTNTLLEQLGSVEPKKEQGIESQVVKVLADQFAQRTGQLKRNGLDVLESAQTVKVDVNQ